MSHKVHILAFAKDDYREIRSYVKRQFGNNVWKEVEADYKKVIGQIAEMPETGSIPEEVSALGITDYRQRLVRQTRVLYQIKDNEIYVHMFLDTNRDFQTMLLKRLMKIA
ncbi:type II toxin-antitoxin system RelE/ParE family toxin [Burkholderia contaminans]|uniref:type II toxin-antitoxin system RelE/ParE family toxin n=1 Tax=Burkholderia contaminans TaxID=488447 RepID=UPI00158B75E1|nr:type II toxin-antitoxin system RelE/ParE family toxin [Burkholderia contaminans]